MFGHKDEVISCEFAGSCSLKVNFNVKSLQSGSTCLDLVPVAHGAEARASVQEE